jgi:hypothetical protein
VKSRGPAARAPAGDDVVDRARVERDTLAPWPVVAASGRLRPDAQVDRAPALPRRILAEVKAPSKRNAHRQDDAMHWVHAHARELIGLALALAIVFLDSADP